MHKLLSFYYITITLHSIYYIYIIYIIVVYVQYIQQYIIHSFSSFLFSIIIKQFNTKIININKIKKKEAEQCQTLKHVYDNQKVKVQDSSKHDTTP